MRMAIFIMPSSLTARVLQEENALTMTKNKARYLLTGLLALLLLILMACTGSQEQPADSVTLQLNWHHYGAFSGFYAAEQKDMYAEEELAITFLEGGTDVDPTAVVEAGDAHFGVTSADTLLLARAAGKRAGCSCLRDRQQRAASAAAAGRQPGG